MVTAAGTSLRNSITARRICQSLVTTRTDFNFCPVIQSAVSRRSAGGVRCGKAQRYATPCPAPIRYWMANSCGFTSRSTPDTNSFGAQPCRNTSSPRSIRPLAPVRTTTPSVRRSSAGCGKATANQIKAEHRRARQQEDQTAQHSGYSIFLSAQITVCRAVIIANSARQSESVPTAANRSSPARPNRPGPLHPEKRWPKNSTATSPTMRGRLHLLLHQSRSHAGIFAEYGHRSRRANVPLQSFRGSHPRRYVLPAALPQPEPRPAVRPAP